MIFNNLYEYYLLIGLMHGCQYTKPVLGYIKGWNPILEEKVNQAYLLGYEMAKQGNLKIGDIGE